MTRASMPIAVLMLCLAAGTADASVSSTANWSTPGEAVVCGVVAEVPGSKLDPGTGSLRNGMWPGLQCQAAGLPDSRSGVGDPTVHLGQGRSGRARLVYISQDELVSAAPYRRLRSGSLWKRDGIRCAVSSASVRCTNSAGHGFSLSPGHLHTF